MDWDKIKEEFQNSECTIRELAEKYDIKVGSVRYRAGKEGWKKNGDIKSLKKTKSSVRQNKNKREIIIAVADKLLDCVAKAAEELDTYTMKNKVKTKSVEYDSKSGKTGREIICENEQIESAKGIIDRIELKQLVTALRDIKEIYDNQSMGENRIEQLIRGLINDGTENIQ